MIDLRTAHRILIATAIAFFAFYAGWAAARIGGPGGWAQAAASAAAAAGLAVYYRTIGRRRGPPAGSGRTEGDDDPTV